MKTHINSFINWLLTITLFIAVIAIFHDVSLGCEYDEAMNMETKKCEEINTSINEKWNDLVNGKWNEEQGRYIYNNRYIEMEMKRN